MKDQRWVCMSCSGEAEKAFVYCPHCEQATYAIAVGADDLRLPEEIMIDFVDMLLETAMRT